MYTQSKLLENIKELGIEETDLLTAHTSLKSVGKIDATGYTSAAEALISALRESVKKGLLFIPAHTFSNIRETPVFDIRNTMPCIGGVPCAAVEMANRAYDRGDQTCVRSMHVSHSVVAFGEKAKEYVADDRRAVSPVPMFGCYGKLLEQGGKILFIGTKLSNNTFIHAIDEYVQPEGMSAPYEITAIDYDGSRSTRIARNCQGPSAKYVGYQPYLEKAGALSYGKIGDADCILCDAKKCYDVVVAERRNVMGY
ncbi:MAG: AAC(3) family N-acetyltransferase [Clostridia bacterium]|nr:AAC(3) family N-acetyltransferase [Clostridia bacterium]